LFLDSGERLGGVDAAISAWTGALPANRAPHIVSFSATAGLKEVAPGSRHEADILVKEPNGDPVEIRWHIVGERPPGEASRPASYPACIVEAHGAELSFTAPEQPGAYRLYVHVLDGKGAAATANIPFLVRGQLDAGGSDGDR
jgi:hypothetical protein